MQSPSAIAIERLQQTPFRERCWSRPGVTLFSVFLGDQSPLAKLYSGIRLAIRVRTSVREKGLAMKSSAPMR